jgi:hypothetical protein
MIGGNNYGRRFKEQRLSQTSFLFRNVGEPLRFLRVYNRQVESGMSAVLEEDEVDDLTSSAGESEEAVKDAQDSFDIRDLLLDEMD